MPKSVQPLESVDFTTLPRASDLPELSEHREAAAEARRQEQDADMAARKANLEYTQLARAMTATSWEVDDTPVSPKQEIVQKYFDELQVLEAQHHQARALAQRAAQDLGLATQEALGLRRDDLLVQLLPSIQATAAGLRCALAAARLLKFEGIRSAGIRQKWQAEMDFLDQIIKKLEGVKS